MPCSIILHSSLETGFLNEHGSRLMSSKAPAVLCHLSPECMLSVMCVSLGYVLHGCQMSECRYSCFCRERQPVHLSVNTGSTTLAFLPVRWKEPFLPQWCLMRGNQLCNAGTHCMSEASRYGVSPFPVSSHFGFYVPMVAGVRSQLCPGLSLPETNTVWCRGRC